LSSGGLSRRVVVTGYGIISSIGNDRTEVLQSLRCGRSGIEHNPEYADLGFRSQVHGPIRLDMAPLIDRKIRRFMGDGAAYGYLAMREAIAHAGLTEDRISDPRIGLVMGSGGPSTANIVAAADTLRDRGLRKVSAFVVPRAMSSTGSACLSTAYRIQGVSYSLSSACATSAHCVGHGAELIGLGKQDIVFAGGCEEVHWTQSVLFDAMGALSSRHNETPRTASRPYDVDRDGFVISGGGGLLVLEELEHALARGAPIVAELVGYGASSDGYDMVQPSGEGAVRCMRQALEGSDVEVHYINAHGTSTPAGDIRELEAVREVFGDRIPPISATKSLTGHALGAAGAHEAIYSLLMMERDFIAASANVANLDPGAEGMPIVTERMDGVRLDAVMSNSFGFGGTNATLVFQRFTG
jgi:3-oxoacyl-[acyl-carrier-protein] synthase-1